MIQLDVKGHKCPLPILKLSQALAGMQGGEVVQLIADDKGTLLDIPAFTRQTGHALIEQSENAGEYVFVIQKKSAA